MMTEQTLTALLNIDETKNPPRIAASGDWVLAHYAYLEPAVSALQPRLPPNAVFDLSQLGTLDTAGATLLVKLMGEQKVLALDRIAPSLPVERRVLLQTVGAALQDYAAPQAPIDAMGCQKDIAYKIKDKKADYLLAVKDNQGKLHHAFEEKFPVTLFSDCEDDSFSTQEISHGRKETRLHIVSDVTSDFCDFEFKWKGLKKLCVALSFRQKKEEKSAEGASIRYYIFSKDLNAKE